MNLNLKTLAAKDTDTFQLRNGDDELLMAGDQRVTATVYGPGSKEYQKATAKATSRAIERMKKRGKVDQSAEDRLAESAGHLADITHSFEGLDYEGLTGRELAIAIYSDPQLGFIAEQVNKHSADWANFTKGSQAS